MTTLLRVRGQVASNLLGQHVQIGDEQVLAPVSKATVRATSRAGDPASAARGGGDPQQHRSCHGNHAGRHGCIRGPGRAAAITVMLLVTRRAAPPGPASHVPIFAPVAGALKAMSRRTRSRSGVALAGSAWLAGCAAVPDYRPPQPLSGAQLGHAARYRARPQATPPSHPRNGGSCTRTRCWMRWFRRPCAPTPIRWPRPTRRQRVPPGRHPRWALSTNAAARRHRTRARCRPRMRSWRSTAIRRRVSGSMTPCWMCPTRSTRSAACAAPSKRRGPIPMRHWRARCG